MAINRERLRNTGKAGDKADFKNTLDKYSLSEKETPNRERGIEVMMEKMEKME